jgi:hypothetical protein
VKLKCFWGVLIANFLNFLIKKIKSTDSTQSFNMQKKYIEGCAYIYFLPSLFFVYSQIWLNPVMDEKQQAQHICSSITCSQEICASQSMCRSSTVDN